MNREGHEDHEGADAATIARPPGVRRWSTHFYPVRQPMLYAVSPKLSSGFEGRRSHDEAVRVFFANARTPFRAVSAAVDHLLLGHRLFRRRRHDRRPGALSLSER